ncbi:MAG: hypothetical protein WCM76_00300 [Bacteroidota bacterium]
MKKLMLFLVIGIIAVSVNAQTKTTIKTADLKKEITDYVLKNYPGYKITEAFKMETNKVVTYEVLAAKEAAKITLVFNDKGAFVKKEEPRTNMGSKPVNKTGAENKDQGTKKPASTKK